MSRDLDPVLEELVMTPGCVVLPPVGRPVLDPRHRLPDDLARFYDLCGGALVQPTPAFGLAVHGPADLRPSNGELALEGRPGDRSQHWYLVAHVVDAPLELVSIDLHPDRLGRCADSFWDVHASPGNCALVATSFTDLVARALQHRGEGSWWLDAPLGDAYD